MYYKKLRRMKSLLLGSLIAVAITACGGNDDAVDLQFDAANPQATYAAQRLKSVLKERNLEKSDFEIKLTVSPDKLKPEAFTITPGDQSLVVSGGDGRGVIYGAMSIVEQLRNGATLGAIKQEKGET